MTEYKAPEFYELCSSEQLLEFNELIQLMAKEDALPLMEGTEHITGFVQEITHFLKIRTVDRLGLEYLAVDMDYYWKDGEVKSRAITVYKFDDAGELELVRYQMHTTTTEPNPILN